MHNSEKELQHKPEMWIRKYIFLMLLELAVARKVIQCKSVCHDEEESIAMQDGNYLTCEVTRRGNKGPISAKTNKAAPKLKDARLDWYLSPQDKLYLALNATWIQAERFLSGYNEGFLITFARKEVAYPFYVNVSISTQSGNTSVQNFRNDTCPYIFFNFLCFGLYRPREDLPELDIGPGETWKATFRSFPLRTDRDKDYTITEYCTIPKCKESKKISKAKTSDLADEDCKNHWKEQHRRRKQRRREGKIEEEIVKKKLKRAKQKKLHPEAICSTEYATPLVEKPTPDTKVTPESITGIQENWKIPTLISLSLILIFGLLISIMAYFRKRAQHDEGCSKMLAVIDTKDPNLVEKCHRAMQHLKRDLDYSLESNWKSNKKISETGAKEWFRKAIISADVIVFISPNNDLDTENSESSSCTSDGNEFQIFWNYWSNYPGSTQKACIRLQKTATERKNIQKYYPNLKIFQFKEQFGENDELYKYLRRLREEENKNNSISTRRDVTETIGESSTETVEEANTHHQTRQYGSIEISDYSQEGARPKYSTMKV